MNDQVKEQIAFDVETERILQILCSEIYDSPKAFLRENVQNAYDAILMRCTAQDLPIAERKIEIPVEKGRLTVSDDGAAVEYLSQYVRFLPVPVLINGRLISQQAFEDALGSKAEGFTEISSRAVARGEFSGTLRTFINVQARVLVRLDAIALNGNP